MPTKALSELKAQIGETNRTVERLVVEAGKVDEFARATKNDDPVHRSSEAAQEQGLAAIPAPLTFTRTSYFPRYRPPDIDESFGFDLGFRSEQILHGEQAYEFERPVTVGDVLTGETTLEDVYQRDGTDRTLTFAVFRTEFRDESGSLVVTAWNTRIEAADPRGESDD